MVRAPWGSSSPVGFSAAPGVQASGPGRFGRLGQGEPRLLRLQTDMHHRWLTLTRSRVPWASGIQGGESG